MSGDSSSDEFSDSSPNQTGLLGSQIADKFRCLLSNCSSSAIVEFLESFLTFVRKRPSDSREFTGSICRYLLASKDLISKTPQVELYCGRIRNILVIYCVLELRLIDCFDDETEVASNIFMKIILLMKGCTSITVLDVLIDINEHVRSFRSKHVMAIVYRYYLTRNPTGAQRVLDDTDFVKHLILFRSWYNAEAMSEKIDVFKCFASTIKPKEELRSNQCFLLLKIGEAVDYKKMLQQPLPRNALIRAVRDAENNDDDEAANIDSLDLSVDEEPEIKVEAYISTKFSNDTITIDDDDDECDFDMPTISYLPHLFQRLDAIDQYEKGLERFATLQNIVPCETLVISSDSEPNCEAEHSFVRMADANEDTINLLSDTTVQSSSSISCNNVEIKICYRKKKSKKRPYERKSDQATDAKRSSTNRKKKRVTFSNPLVTTHVFDDLFNCNFIGTTSNLSHVSTSAAELHHPSSSYQSGDSGRHRHFNCENRRSRGKKRSHFGFKQRKTSIDDWMKRRRLTTNECTASGNANVSGHKRIECRIDLKRLDYHEQTLGNELGPTNEMHSERICSSNKDITVSQIVEAEQRHSKSTRSIKTRCISSGSTSSESVFETVWITTPMRTKGKGRVTVNLAAHKNGQELGLENCAIRLKRLKSDLKPTTESPNQISTSMIDLNSRFLMKTQNKCQFQRSFRKTSVFQSSSISLSREVRSALIPSLSIKPEKCATENPATTSSTYQLLSLSEMDGNDDLPSPEYSPHRGNECSQPETAANHPSSLPITPNESIADADELYAILCESN